MGAPEKRKDWVYSSECLSLLLGDAQQSGDEGSLTAFHPPQLPVAHGAPALILYPLLARGRPLKLKIITILGL